MNDLMQLEITTEEGFDLVAALEMSDLDHEVLMAKLLRLLYQRRDVDISAA